MATNNKSGGCVIAAHIFGCHRPRLPWTCFKRKDVRHVNASVKDDTVNQFFQFAKAMEIPARSASECICKRITKIHSLARRAGISSDKKLICRVRDDLYVAIVLELVLNSNEPKAWPRGAWRVCYCSSHFLGAIVHVCRGHVSNGKMVRHVNASVKDDTVNQFFNLQKPWKYQPEAQASVFVNE